NEGHLKNLLKDHNFDKDVSIIENLPVPSENSTDSFEDDSDDKSVGKYSDPELLSKLHEALKHLPEKDRALLIDYYCFDYVKRSYKELAKEHKVSVGYAFKVVKRSTEELKRILSPPDG
ncbi:MAG: hypothetical protein LBH05_03310, partial [Deferribacteraceae bacterium]|nr:hypothetical protein [Deferribacteraceae bacterium]